MTFQFEVSKSQFLTSFLVFLEFLDFLEPDFRTLYLLFTVKLSIFTSHTKHSFPKCTFIRCSKHFYCTFYWKLTFQKKSVEICFRVIYCKWPIIYTITWHFFCVPALLFEVWCSNWYWLR